MLFPIGTQERCDQLLVDRDGKIAKVYDKVDPKTHPKDVLDFVKSLK